MSQKTRDLIAQGVAAFNSGDNAGMLALIDPAIEFQPLRAVLEGSVYRGHEGFRRWLEDMAEDWHEFGIEVIDVHEPGHDTVLVHATVHARARASGVEVDYPGAWLCELRDGLLARCHFYRDVEAGMEAARQAEGLPNA
jgi:ketosteroid isomerase-like protein